MEKSTLNLKSMFSADEVSIKELLNFFWKRRWYVIISFFIFGIIGYIGASTAPLDYEARCVLLTEGIGSGGGGSSALQGLAGLAGINAGGNGGGDGSSGNDLYPVILSSRPFLLELAKDTIFLSEDAKQPTTLAKYFANGEKKDALDRAKTYFLSLPSHLKEIPSSVKKMFSSDKKINNTISIATEPVHDYGVSLSNSASVVELNGQEIQIAGILRRRIKLSQNGNQIILTVLMPEARLSAEATKLVLNKLIKYVTKYKTSKQLETVQFLEARTLEAGGGYKKNQQKVAGFKDSNYGVVFQSVQSEQERLQNEFVLSSTIYNQLASQLEQARIQLKKDTPLFTVLEPVYVPENPNLASSFKMVLSYALFGAFLGFIIIALQMMYPLFYKKKTLSNL